MDVIRFEKLSLTARIEGRAVEVLRGIDLAVAKGGTLGLVGESGAGKSMIGSVISGLLPEDFLVSSGRLSFNGQDLLALNPGQRRALLGRHIAFIPQEPLTALNPVRTIGDQFNEYLSHLDVARSRRPAMALKQLTRVSLPNAPEMLQRYPHELSGGQCQRVLIAMAFSGQPALVVADEPTTALDVVTQAQIMRLIAEQQASQGTAMLFITHDLRLAAQVCENIGVMYAGDMVEFGPASAVLTEPTHPYTRSLLAAMPSLSGDRRMLPALDEHMPGLMAFEGIPGCRFASRCVARDADCKSRQVAITFVSDKHWARCGKSCQTHGGLEAGKPMPPPLSTADAAPAVLSFKDVRLTYHASRGFFGLRQTSFDAVKPTSLEVRAGEMVGIVGESGSGKTSIGRLIVGLEKASAGTIRVNGHDPSVRDQGQVYLSRRDAQMIFQDPQSALNPRRSVMRLLTQALECGGARTIDRRAEAARLAHSVRLPSDCLERFPSQLSGGQKQRVNIGRALCLMPSLVVADEIVSGLDVSVQAHVLNLLLDLNRKHGITVVLISHDLAVVRYLCSRVFLMSHGEIVEHGPTDEVFKRPRHAYTRMLMDAVPPERAGASWPAAVLPSTQFLETAGS